MLILSLNYFMILPQCRTKYPKHRKSKKERKKEKKI